MTVWCHLPTIFNQRRALRIAGLLTLCVALTTTLFFGDVSHATAGINQTLSYQGRLLTSTGSVVPDGYYNIQFKIYQDGDGQEVGDTGGALKWTESYVDNGGTSGVKVTNGYFSVNLGSLNQFGSQVDWNQDTLWLSMNVAGSSGSCTTFNSGSCVADGEMLPMKRITSVPYALQSDNSNKLGNKTADNFVQLAQGVQTDAGTNTSSIFINKTGANGNFLQLQNAGADMFNITNNGDLQFGSASNHILDVGGAAANTAGSNLTVFAGWGGSGGGANGGSLFLQGGGAGGSNANGGDVVITGGSSAGTGNSGGLYLGSADTSTIQIGDTNLSSGTQTVTIGTNNTIGGTTNVTIGAGGSADGGTTTLQAKNSVIINTNGTTRATFSDTTNTVYFGNGVSASAPNDFALQGTGSTTSGVAGGSLTIQGGNATTGDANGGNVTLIGGTGSGVGGNGLVVLGTPTFSTVTNDTNCYASGTLVASSCTIAASSVNNSAAVIIGFSANNQTASLPNPTNTTAGRIFYVTAASGSHAFTLSINGGGSGNQLTMHPNTTATLMWNGSAWTSAGASNTTTLQDAYDNSSSSSIALNGTTGGLVISDSSTGSVNGTLLNVKDSSANSLFSISDGVVPNIQIGTGSGTGTATLFTLDKSGSAPSGGMLGSMYYDTAKGTIECYQANGWGACGDAPDSFISLNPQYPNAVTHGSNSGTLASDFCSDSLNINNGTSSQPSICGTHETYNYESWTSSQTSTQEKDIYVTYQLPSTFKNFVTGSTSLMGRTDGTNANVNYQVYRSDSSGLTACGSSVATSTGTQTTWQKGTASSTSDPSSCSFVAGDSIVIKISLNAYNNTNAYASTLNFAYTNN